MRCASDGNSIVVRPQAFIELQPGNAAPIWLRASQTAREVNKKLNYDWLGTPLKDLPKEELRERLASYGPALRFAEQAARRRTCDWETPPFNPVHWDFPYSELQSCRELAQLLSIRCRLALSEGDFDTAAHSLRLGLALARHLGEGDTIIQSLVGIAIAAVMFADIEADVIRFAIAHYRGQMSEVARKLQIGRSTLYRKLDDLGVEDAENPPQSTDSFAAG